MHRVTEYLFSSNALLGVKCEGHRSPEVCQTWDPHRKSQDFFNVILKISGFVHVVGEVAISEELD